MKSNFLIVNATILKLEKNKLHIKLNDAEKNICSSCEKKAGCKSLSIAPLLIKDKEISVKINEKSNALLNNNLVGYQKGEVINLQLPANFLSYSLALTVGIPLLSFILSILLFSKINSEINTFLISLSVLLGSSFVIKKFFNDVFLKKVLKIIPK